MKNPNLIEFYENRSIVKAGPVTVSPGLRPRRIVLRDLLGEYVTHVEYLRMDTRQEFRNGRQYDVVTFSNEAFEHGHYFSHRASGGRERALGMAMADFVARDRGESPVNAVRRAG